METSRALVLPPEAELPERHPDAPSQGQPIPQHYARCFGCGDDTAGLQLDVRAGEGLSVHTRFTVSPRHQGAPGLAHGGLLTTALDETLASLQFLLLRPSVTARLEVDFLLPVPVGSTLWIEAAVLGVARRKIYTRATGRLGAPDGPEAVRAEALFVVVELQHFQTHGNVGEGFVVNP